MAATALDYRWSSHAHNAHGVDEPRIKPHPAYIALSATGAERNSAYQRLFDEGLSDMETDALRLATNQQKTWGSERFRLQIEALAKRELEVRRCGRPQLKEKCT
jgi:putative transposase